MDGWMDGMVYRTNQVLSLYRTEINWKNLTYPLRLVVPHPLPYHTLLIPHPSGRRLLASSSRHLVVSLPSPITSHPRADRRTDRRTDRALSRNLIARSVEGNYTDCGNADPGRPCRFGGGALHYLSCSVLSRSVSPFRSCPSGSCPMLCCPVLPFPCFPSLSSPCPVGRSSEECKCGVQV